MTDTLEEYWERLGALRSSVGVMLLPAERYSHLLELALRSDAALVDFRDAAQAIILAGSRYVDFRAGTLTQVLHRLVDVSQSRRLIVQNFDLGLARLKRVECDLFWETLTDNFPRNSRTMVVLALPNEQTAWNLLPSAEMIRQWLDLKRAFRVPLV